MFYGFIPGSVGETSKLLIILGALFLIFTKIGSWRIISVHLLEQLVMGLIFNQVVDAGMDYRLKQILWIDEHTILATLNDW
jgi:Na+-transporting NADH:ubiquinone oxidoreductase subunit B